jgi:PAS domain S-box-containing protein
MSALRASRLLSAATLVAGVGILVADAGYAGVANSLGGLLSPRAAQCTALLAVAALLVSLPPRLGQALGQLAAAFAGLLAMQSLLADNLPVLLAPDVIHELPPWLTYNDAQPLAEASVFMMVNISLALICVPLRGRFAHALFPVAAGIGLLAATSSLIGFALDSRTFANLGLDGDPTALASFTSALLLLATLAQRGDGGWLGALLSPSAAGSSARGIIVWTVIAPLAFALLALAGERQGLYDLHFAFALLAAAMCCGLTALVMWNAARVERAQARAASARDAMQLAANRLRLARSATGIQMWEWLPASREWYSIDGAERLDPSTNEFLEAGLTRAMRDGRAEFEFPLQRGEHSAEQCWMLAKCWREQRESESIVVGITVDITERKLAALALESSETRLQLAARALPGFVYDWNCASGKMLRTSGIEQMLGYQAAEISPVSRWWEDQVHPDDRAGALPARVAREAGPDSVMDSIACEYRVRHKDGGWLWIWDHCILVRDRSGHVTRVVGSVLDITERKEAEARLAVSEHRFKAALLATTGIFWTFSPDGRARGEQTSWSAFTGQSAEELHGMGWIDALHPDDIDATREAWHRAITTQQELVTVHRVRRRDGEYRTFSVHAVPVNDERGHLIEWVGSHTDITEQREAEQRVRETVRRLELALDASSVGMWDWDLESDRMIWTRQTHLITGIPVEGFTGEARQFFTLLRPAQTDHAAEFRRQVQHPDAVTEVELELERPDGARRWIQQRATAMADARGRVRRVVGTLRDVTHRKEFEAEREALLSAERAARSELVSAAQMKDEFLATVSHELRTPLNAILGWATLLQRPRVDAATVADGLKVIERNARAQTQLLGDLLDANQLMSGKLSLTFEPMDLNAAVRATLDSMRVTIATRKVEIVSRLTPKPLPVMGDSVRLQQVVSNLLSNAIKFTPAGGVISVTTDVAADQAFLEVRDSGEGISAEFLPHLFEKFRQAEGGSARRFAGLGLGLAITRQLVESHGGAISVHSDGRGKGAMFRVQLPRLKATEAELLELPPPSPATQLNGKPLTGLAILAVDDEADSREYLERLLAEQGADVVSVASAAEALAALEAEPGRFQLLVSDIGMPGSTGYDLIETVRHRLNMAPRDLPAVALTAFSRSEDSARALDKGFQKHLAKPVQVGRLIGAIRQLTGRQQAQARAPRRAPRQPAHTSA